MKPNENPYKQVNMLITKFKFTFMTFALLLFVDDRPAQIAIVGNWNMKCSIVFGSVTWYRDVVSTALYSSLRHVYVRP